MNNGTIKEIGNIEWLFTDEYDDSVLQGVATNKIFEHIKKLDKLPNKSGEIQFSNDTWDFTSIALKRVPKRKSTFNFTDLSLNFNEQLKFFTLTKIWEDKCKLQTIYVTQRCVKDFLKYLINSDIHSLKYVSLQTVQKYLKSKSQLSPNTIHKYKTSLLDFFKFYSNNYVRIDWKDIHKHLSKTDSVALNAQRENNKWDTIPDDYFNNLIACLSEIMSNENAFTDDRGIAAMYILLSQTGLRNGELRDVPINSLKSHSILNGSKTAHYMEYMTSKGVRGNGNYKNVYTIMTDLACDAYKILEKIYDEHRKSINSDYLFTPLKAKTLPVTENSLSRMFVSLSLKNGEKFGCINVREKYPNMLHQPLDRLKKRGAVSQLYLKNYTDTDTVATPRPHQFRVKLCTELINQGVSIYYVQRHMAHLTKEITYGYYRREHDLTKEKEYAESVMKMLITGETEIMGDGKTELMLRINDYMKKDNLNVAADLDQVVKQLTKKVPIRAKSGGICIKSGPIRECSKSDETDNFYCSFGMCTNLFHAFFMIDINYQKYTSLLKTIKYNQEKGFNKAVEKEIGKLKWVLNKYLIPELKELKKEIESKGIKTIKKQYPQVSYFIDNYDAIYMEVTSWLK